MLKTEQKKVMNDANQDTMSMNHEAILKADLNNQIVRKVRAQTLFDGMARELTPLISKALSIINPNKNEYHPDESIRATGSLVIGTNLNNFEIKPSEPWGFARQLDYFIGLCQSGLYCLEPKKILELARQAHHQSDPISTFAKLLCEHAPFQLSAENKALIERLIPEEFAHYPDEPTTNSDQKRFFKLARILYLIESYELPKDSTTETIASAFNATFPKLIDTFLEQAQYPADFTPRTKQEEEAFFITLNRYMDAQYIESHFLPAVRRFMPHAARLLDFRVIDRSQTQTLSTDHLEEDDRHLSILKKLSDELKQGASSLVGGRDYTRFRFAESILKRAAYGHIPIAIVDGTKEEAESLILNTTLKDATEILAIDICGQYGDFSKTLYKYTDSTGEKKLLFTIAQPGEYRVLSNASALLLYGPKKDQDGFSNKAPKHISAESISCFYRTTSINTIIRDEVKDALNYAEETKPQHINSVDTILTLPATSASTILEGLKEAGLILDSSMIQLPTLGKTYSAWVYDKQKNRTIQLLIPSVGGSGLYGDTAGVFVAEYLRLAAKDKKGIFSKCIKFLATAGKIKTLGFDAKEGDLVMPTGKFVAYNLSSQIEIPLRKHDALAITKYIDHAWAPCPAIETNHGFQVLLGQQQLKLGMIDVEGLPIASAIQEYNLHHPDKSAEFSPIYIVSDTIDPDRFIPKNGHDYSSYAFGCRAGMALHLSQEQLEALYHWVLNH